MTDIRAGDVYQLDESRLPWLELDVEEDVGSPLLRIFGWLVLGVFVLGVGFAGGYWVRHGLNVPAGSQPPVASFAANPGKSGSPTLTEEPAATTALSTPTAAQSPLRVSSHTLERKKASRRMRRHRAGPLSNPVTSAAYDRILIAQNASVPIPPTITIAVAEPASAPARASAAGERDQSIQLGAFDSRAIADGAWSSMRSRFGFLQSLTPNVTSVSVNGRRFYRLRATGPHAEALCKWLRRAREPCIPVRPRDTAKPDGKRLATGIGVGNRAGYL